jgi:predicted nucleic acid-binding protein
MGGGGGRGQAELPARPVVSDSSSLIALSQINCLHLLEGLFGTVIAPPMVQQETARTMTFPTWLVVRTPQTPLDTRLVDARLDAGEHQVIHLAMETSARRVILDDLKARRTARSLGLPIFV